MKKPKIPYTFFNNFCLRTPLLPLKVVLNHKQKGQIEEGYLKKQWKKNNLKEAVFLASPYLHSELELLFNDKKNNFKKEGKLKQSFLKYLIRASTRCTPFGLFAGISVGSFGSETKLLLEQEKHLIVKLA